MNLEKIFSALNQDSMNSALTIICFELEQQGFEIEIEGIKIASKELVENKYPSLEEVLLPLNVRLFFSGIEIQKFSINFIDFHKVVFQEYKND